MLKIRHIIQIITYACVVLSLSSVLEHLDTYHALAFLFLASFSVCQDYRRILEIPRWLLNSISLGLLFLASYRITPEFLIEPILDALTILLALKLLEYKKIRDYMQIYIMCIFVLIGSTLISMSVTFLLYFSLLLTLITISLILLAFYSHNPDMGLSREYLYRIIHQSLLIFSLSIPIGVILFIILPRTSYPFLSFLNKAGIGRSGFSDTISLGEVAEIQEDNAVIFRAEMERVEDSELYWRGIVLDEFDGIKWTSGGEADVDRSPDDVEGREIVQTIYLEPYGNKYLFALDRPTSFSVYSNKFSRTRIRPFKTMIFERIRYRAISRISAASAQPMIDRGPYVRLPEAFSPRVRSLVEDLVSDKTEVEQVKTLMTFLQRGSFQYSLESLPVSTTPFEDFLFVHKRGNCEFFASSLAVMLRTAGIPARLIGGYRGGNYNDTGKYYLVTQRNAHVWVEAYLSSHGWLRLDPTPPLLEVPWHAVGGRFLLQLRLIFDTFNYYWHKVIIDYDFTRQVEILNAIRERITRPDIKVQIEPSALGKPLMLFGLLIAVPILLYILVKTHKRQEERILARFLSKMAAYGYEKGKHEGLEEFIARIEQKEIRDQARMFVEGFEQVYYRDREFTGEIVRGLRAQINRI